MVKTHRTGNPLRPIVSQNPTHTYETAKILNTIITQQLNAKCRPNSADDFLQILRTTDARGRLVSVDMEAVFTKVPINVTIDTIWRTVILCLCIYEEVRLGQNMSKINRCKLIKNTNN